MNILVTGSNGQLGNEIRDLSKSYSQYNYFFTDINELDITDKHQIEQFVKINDIKIIINCAAYTNVDKAEADEDTARLVNAIAPKNLAEVAHDYGCKLVHVSTDYVFDGRGFQPYTEECQTAPKTVYGITKDDGEQYIQTINKDNSIIIRTAWLYSTYGNNFVKTMLKYGKEKDQLKVVFDQIGSPTYAKDLAQIIFNCLEDWHSGLYHFTNEGVCSWYDFTLAILKDANIECEVLPILSSEYAYKTPRPHYSVLDKSKIKKTFNLKIRHWTDALKECIEKINQ